MNRIAFVSPLSLEPDVVREHGRAAAADAIAAGTDRLERNCQAANHMGMRSKGNRVAGWDFWIDRGGTFTDIVARSPGGEIVARKLLSEAPDRYQDAAIAGMEQILRDRGTDRDEIATLRMGTTVTTNALLQRAGEPTVLVVTKGFRDLLRIGYQNRPDLFALEIRRPQSLATVVIEAEERIGPDGEVVLALDEASLRTHLQKVHDAGYRTAAVALMHGYRFSSHEKAAARICLECGFETVVTSHDVSPHPRIVSRAETTVAEAYLSPVLERYLSTLSDSIDAARISMMQSNGGLARIDAFRAKDSLYSGPAGGVVGMARTAGAAGYTRLIGFDMGGTSTDVSLFDEEVERRDETVVGGVRVRVPAVDVHSVAAGGGSIVRFDGERFRVGPESAGAYPGPACYRRGGPLTVTDCNVLLGRVRPEFFPAVFGSRGDQTIAESVVRRGLERLAADVSAAHRTDWTAEHVAAGFLRVAVEKMANAIREVSIQRGLEVSDFVLSCFGGASGQHACAVADELGIKRILIHPLCGLLSAYGIGLADFRLIKERSIESELSDQSLGELARVTNELKQSAIEEIARQGINPDEIQVETRLQVRYSGSDTSLSTSEGDAAAVRKEFEDLHRRTFGYHVPERALVVTSVSAEASGGGRSPADTFVGLRTDRSAPARPVRIWSGGQFTEAMLHWRSNLEPGAEVTGPAIVAEEYATTVVDEGWIARVSPSMDLELERAVQPSPVAVTAKVADPVLLEVFNNLFRHVAEQMGRVLQRTARSVNVKERLDFSCAVFDGSGDLVANAPHIPVHLGSMSDSVKRIMEMHGDSIREGDSFLINDPAHGGTHLPDLTVITPVFCTSESSSFFVASRAHHADVGGITPGSMPAASVTIDEEGVLFEGERIVNAGRFRRAELLRLLGQSAYPARSPDDNVADVEAQIAANQQGVAGLLKAVERYVLGTVEAYMRHVKANAAAAVRNVLGSMKGGKFRVKLDTGQVISVSVRVDRARRTAEIDFAGTSARAANNFNAPIAITKAVVLYVFRTLIADDIPLNEGCLEALRITIPDGCMLNPRHPDAVAAGNVETSQCLADAMFAALGKLAASQGTMNNFTFGGQGNQYYETVCGGAGAGPGIRGADAVHTHMTNSRLTDPEVMEMRFPVMVEEFSIRAGSGGNGRYCGGNGVVRRLRFREPVSVSVLSNRRLEAPYGLGGGEAGLPGRNSVLRTDGRLEELASCASVGLDPGDVFIMETPGGGGYGRVREADPGD
jgi:5-oxoprolinase (ATP-hydrolysing)